MAQDKVKQSYYGPGGDEDKDGKLYITLQNCFILWINEKIYLIKVSILLGRVDRLEKETDSET